MEVTVWWGRGCGLIHFQNLLSDILKDDARVLDCETTCERKVSAAVNLLQAVPKSVLKQA